MLPLRCRIVTGMLAMTARCSAVTSRGSTVASFSAVTPPRCRPVLVISRGGSTGPGRYDDNKESRRSRPLWGVQRFAQQAVANTISAAGFVSCSAKSLYTNRKQFGQWKKSLTELDVYLRDSGIHQEVSGLINRRLLGNLMILSRIQFETLKNRGDDRDLVRMRRLHMQTNLPSPPPEEAARYMKYALSAYGESMIRAAEMHTHGKIDTRHSPLPRTKIAKHVDLPSKDVVLTDLDEDSGESNHLRHFVAVDHARKKVILSIRGTFNLAECVVDVVGFSRPFLRGEAHSEMALMAERVWDKAGDTVRELLKEGGNDYELILTGHSLGAGTSLLLNMLIHADRRRHVHGRKVRCFAFASPPVFAPLYAAPHDAIKAATNYIHERDAVPFLSVDSIRHFFNCLGIIDNKTRKMGFLERQKMVIGFHRTDESLRADVLKASLRRLPSKPGAPILAIPAASNIWIRERGFAGSDDYDARTCDSIRLSKRGILLDQNMLLHHFPTSYEHALSRLNSASSTSTSSNDLPPTK
mmetsp:Transcript_2113/g.6094  ORF Transcript_2113/g.6094 Transcript_2113/m.6094 type:complete len:526 (+) Transcript_2113:108-1685(+)